MPQKAPRREDPRIITCYLSEEDIRYVETLQKAGVVISRSEYIRLAVHNQISRDMKTYKFQRNTIEQGIEWSDERVVKVRQEDGTYKIHEILGEA